MMPPEDVHKKIIGEWLDKAETDLAVAKRLLSDEEPFCTAIAFHCQQSAEKYLKAMLTFWNIDFPKTHVLAALIGLVETRDKHMAESLMDAVILTPYGVELRYPGDRPEVSLQEAREAFDLASKVRTAILESLPHGE